MWAMKRFGTWCTTHGDDEGLNEVEVRAAIALYKQQGAPSKQAVQVLYLNRVDPSVPLRLSLTMQRLPAGGRKRKES